MFNLINRAQHRAPSRRSRTEHRAQHRAQSTEQHRAPSTKHSTAQNQSTSSSTEHRAARSTAHRASFFVLLWQVQRGAACTLTWLLRQAAKCFPCLFLDILQIPKAPPAANGSASASDYLAQNKSASRGVARVTLPCLPAGKLPAHKSIYRQRRRPVDRGVQPASQPGTGHQYGTISAQRSAYGVSLSAYGALSHKRSHGDTPQRDQPIDPDPRIPGDRGVQPAGISQPRASLSITSIDAARVTLPCLPAGKLPAHKSFVDSVSH